MERINAEIFLSSMFCLGYDRIDSLLYTYVLEQFLIDNQKKQEFEFADGPFSELFLQFVELNDKVYKLKYRYTIDTDVSPLEGYYRPIKEALKTNKKLMAYLYNLDLKPIVTKKMQALINQINDWPMLFSEKEKEVIYEMFHQKEENRQRKKVI